MIGHVIVLTVLTVMPCRGLVVCMLSARASLNVHLKPRSVLSVAQPTAFLVGRIASLPQRKQPYNSFAANVPRIMFV